MTDSTYEMPQAEDDAAVPEEPAIDAYGQMATSAYSRLRFVHVDNFEPSIVLPAESREAYLRRFSTLFVDEKTAYLGGNAKVMRALNAKGESLAIKIAAQGDDGRAQGLLQHEYRVHSMLSGLRGFPRIFGKGTCNGVDVLVMEWVEGVPLSRAIKQLSVDDEGRLSPLVAARLGRDLFDILSRMELVEGGVVHRDISLRNIMVCTSLLSVAQQAEEGVFDLRLIDFGSASSPSIDDAAHTTRAGGATSAYAAPELLEADAGDDTAVDMKPAIDVYAAGSVLFRLVSGEVPFESQDANGENGGTLLQLKQRAQHKPLTTAHMAAQDIQDVFVHEPEVGVACQHAAAELTGCITPEDLREALEAVDALLIELIEDCMNPEQPKRPDARVMSDALASFAFHYAENIGCALRGETLIPCSTGMLNTITPARARAIMRRTAKAVCSALCVAAVLFTSLLAHGAEASCSLFGSSWEGSINGWAIAGVLVVPIVLGLALRFTGTKSFAGFIRGSAGVVAGALVSILLICNIQSDVEAISRALIVSVLLIAVCTWCFMVMDFALSRTLGKRRSTATENMLPASSQPLAKEVVKR